MKTNRLISTVVIFCCFMAVSFGQRNQGDNHKGKGTIEDRVNKRLDKMDEVVKFTGHQRSDMKVMMTDLGKRKKDAFCANDPGTDGMKNAMKAINKEKKEGVKKILSDDQINLWKDFMKQQKANRKNGKQNNKDDDEK